MSRLPSDMRGWTLLAMANGRNVKTNPGGGPQIITWLYLVHGRNWTLCEYSALVHLSVYVLVCSCVYPMITIIWVVVGQRQCWIHVCTVCVGVYVCTIVSMIISTHALLGLCEQDHFYQLRRFTCIVDNDGGCSCSCVRGLTYKVWDREEIGRVQTRG